ncbi:MAG: DUF1329 domain-containing protein, partial [Candidatus Binatia bacterium]
MTHPVALGRALAAAVLLAALPCAAEDAVPPERIIDRTNVSDVAELLPESVARWVERGDFVLREAKLRFEPRWDQSFVAASERNRGRYLLDGHRNLVEAESGARPEFVFGFPFPEIEASDADAGAKVMWNRWFAVHKRSQIRFPLRINLVGRGGLVRTVGSRLETLAYQGREGEPLPNPERTEWREIVRFVSPSYVEGTTTLTWRFFDERWDNVWLYLPIIRRLRQATSTNRSDALAGSDVVLDDGLVWAGKNQSFRWKLLGEREILVPTATLDPQPLHAGATWENGTEWVTGEDFTGVRWGWETEGWKGAPWAPVGHYWVKRPVWVVEGRSRDPYYAYGRQVFYLDRDTFHAYYKIVDTPAGDYWKTVMVDMGMACA